jgi:hypothetical protein
MKVRPLAKKLLWSAVTAAAVCGATGRSADLPVFHVQGFPKETEFRTFDADTTKVFLCGAYSRLGDITSGFSLHVFPDGTALIEEWSDISEPTVAVRGTWSIAKDATVLFDWSEARFGGGLTEDYFVKTYGTCKRMKLFITFRRVGSEDVALVSEELIRSELEHAYLRRTEYTDWKKIADRFSKKD